MTTTQIILLNPQVKYAIKINYEGLATEPNPFGVKNKKNPPWIKVRIFVYFAIYWGILRANFYEDF